MRDNLVKLLQILIVFKSFTASVSGGLKWVRVQVPPYKGPGESALLFCDFDLGVDTLYAVKWYKDHEEFYRYVPRARPHKNSFPVEGVFVNMTGSDSKKVLLKQVNVKTSGLFRCEVSAEAPSFSSALSEAPMNVLYLPQEDPLITGLGNHYQIGKEIALNCTSGRSFPPQHLSWFINEQKVVSRDSLINYPPMEHKHDLVSSKLGLRFTLNNRHFHRGSMRVKCVATLQPPTVSHSESEISIQDFNMPDAREALLLVTSSTSPSALTPLTSLIVSLLLKMLL